MSVHREGYLVPGGCLVRGGVPGPGGCLVRGVPGPGGVSGGDPPRTATAAGSTHPTGMYPCSIILCRFTSINLHVAGSTLVSNCTSKINAPWTYYSVSLQVLFTSDYQLTWIRGQILNNICINTKDVTTSRLLTYTQETNLITYL